MTLDEKLAEWIGDSTEIARGEGPHESTYVVCRRSAGSVHDDDGYWLLRGFTIGAVPCVSVDAENIGAEEIIERLLRGPR